MDSQQFDQPARALSAAATRRGLLTFLATLPVVGRLVAMFAVDAAATEERRTHRQRPSVGSENHKHKGRRRKHKRHRRKPKPKHGSPAACDVCARGCPFSSLQAAIDAANSGTTIRICAGTYLGSDGIADVDKDLTIIGAGDGADPATSTILDADGSGPVLHIPRSRTVTVQGVRITGGVDRAGVSNEGDLTMTGCTVTGNQGGASGEPGGILSLGSLTMTDCTVSENIGHTGNAGGIRAFGALRLTRCTITGNTGFTGGLGLALITATIVDSSITDNDANSRASANGGGIRIDQGVLTLIRSTIRDNRAEDVGGGISNANGTVTLTDSSVSNNEPDNCGVIGAGTYIDPDGGCATP